MCNCALPGSVILNLNISFFVYLHACLFACLFEVWESRFQHLVNAGKHRKASQSAGTEPVGIIRVLQQRLLYE